MLCGGCPADRATPARPPFRFPFCGCQAFLPLLHTPPEAGTGLVGGTAGSLPRGPPGTSSGKRLGPQLWGFPMAKGMGPQGCSRWSVESGCPRNRSPRQRKTDQRAHQQTLPGEACRAAHSHVRQEQSPPLMEQGVWGAAQAAVMSQGGLPCLRPGGARQAALSQHRAGD